jgi:hypothetical protein
MTVLERGDEARAKNRENRQNIDDFQTEAANNLTAKLQF